MVLFDSVRVGIVWFESVRLGSVQIASNRLESLLFGSVSVQITESEKGPSATGTGKANKSKSGWHIEHPSGYKQTYSEDM